MTWGGICYFLLPKSNQKLPLRYLSVSLFSNRCAYHAIACLWCIILCFLFEKRWQISRGGVFSFLVVLFSNVMLVLRHEHPGGKKKQYYLDLDYRVKPDNDIKRGWMSGSSPNMTWERESPNMTDTKTSCSCSDTSIQVKRRSIIFWPEYSGQAGVWQ